MRNILLGLFFVLLVACGQKRETIQALPTIARTTTQIRTLTPLPSAPNKLTTTITNTPTPSRTVAHTSIPLAFPTPNGFLIQYSPDLQWGAWDVIAGACGSILIIQNLNDANLRWELNEQFDYGGETINYAIFPSHWSVDGRFLYFSTTVGCADGGISFRGVTSFQRLTLLSGDVIDMLPRKWINVEISSNSQSLAYISGNRITIRDLLSGIERSVVFKISHQVSAGDIEWSPNNTKFIYIVEIEKDDFTKFMFTMVFVDAENMGIRLVVKDFQEAGRVYWFEWVNNEEILLSIASGNNKTLTFLIDTLSGEIVEIDE